MSHHATRRCWLKCILLLLLIALIGAGVKGYRNARGTLEVVKSGSHLRELGGCLARYTNSHSGNYPSRLSDLVRTEPDIPPDYFIVEWGSAMPATSATREGRAAEMDAGGHCSCGYLAAGRTERDITPNSVLMFENDGVGPTGQIFCLFGDGHGETLPVPKAIDAIIATLREPRGNGPSDIPAATRPKAPND